MLTGQILKCTQFWGAGGGLSSSFTVKANANSGSTVEQSCAYVWVPK